jgi:hypothetical protein
MRYDEPSEHCLCDKCSGNDCEGLKEIQDQRIQNEKRDENNRVLDAIIEVFATRYCTSQDIEHGDIPRIALDELAEVIESLRIKGHP